MQQHSHRLSVLLGVSFVLAALPPAAFARSIECGSENYRYKYCRVDTNGYVELEKQLSDAACRRGRTWGYDDDGVWVDEGCKGRFRVGRSYDPDEDRYDDRDDEGDTKKDLLTTAAVIGGLALLGTMMNRNSGETQYPDPSSNQYPGYNPGGGYVTSVPDWAVGTFRGYDSLYDINLELTITGDGAVNGYANDARVQGSFNNDQIQLGRFAFYVDQVQDGFRATRTDDSRNQVFYRRVR
jgi:hypothetical protein